jgi:D-threo-aldose 1-dehydrogenase
VYLHDPDDHEEQALAEAYPALAKLRDEGVIGAVGVGMNQSRIPLRFVRETDLDCVLLAGRYTLLDRTGAELLDACAERGVAVAIGGVFNSGLLVDPKPTATFDYETVHPDVLAKALELKEICALHGVLLRSAALAFPRRHPAVKSVLLGARSPEEVRDCMEQGTAVLPDDLWNDLARAGF